MTGYPELTGPFRKSVRSAANEACVEVAPLTRGTAVRDAKNPAGAVLAFTGREWSGFSRAARSGRYDLV
jgi:Domain of unknown function (DUF397)